jgi:hypothetical protein
MGQNIPRTTLRLVAAYVALEIRRNLQIPSIKLDLSSKGFCATALFVLFAGSEVSPQFLCVKFSREFANWI